MRDGYLRGEPPVTRTSRQVDVLVAFVEAGGSVSGQLRAWVSNRAQRNGTSPISEPDPA